MQKMKYATFHDPANCSRFTIYFDLQPEVINTSVSWFSTDGYSSKDEIITDHLETLNNIGTGKTKSYWLRRNGGDYDALSDIHSIEKGSAMHKQFIADFKKACGFYPKFDDE